MEVIDYDEVKAYVTLLRELDYDACANVMYRLMKEHEMMSYELQGMNNRAPWARATQREKRDHL